MLITSNKSSNLRLKISQHHWLDIYIMHKKNNIEFFIILQYRNHLFLIYLIIK